MGIQSFADKATKEFYYLGISAHKTGWAHVSEIVKRKLDQLNAASTLNDLKVPPNNKLEALKGKLAGCYSMRVNDQWRVVFEWTNHRGPFNVQVTDYHR